MNTLTLEPPLEALLQDYQHYGGAVAGLAPSTCALRLERARSFLNHLSAQGPVVLRQLAAPAIMDYLTQVTASVPAALLPGLVSGTRCFLRFLHLQGVIPLALDQALPTVARPVTAPPPTYLTEAQLEQLLATPDRRQAVGRRDYAILVCLARWGLRAKELAQLRLSDVDWDHSTVSLAPTKNHRARQLPLLQPVGQALVAYVRRGRPPTAWPQVFVSDTDPPRPMTPHSVGKVVRRTLARAGLCPPTRGAHLLRHTVATHLVQQGASLKAVADVLGHQNLQTTRVYAQVNRPLLAEVAQPWPEVQP